MSRKNDPIELCVEYRHDTDLAVLIKDGDQEVWIPKSLIENRDDIDWDSFEQGDLIEELIIPEWLAEERELI